MLVLPVCVEKRSPNSLTTASNFCSTYCGGSITARSLKTGMAHSSTISLLTSSSFAPFMALHVLFLILRLFAKRVSAKLHLLQYQSLLPSLHLQLIGQSQVLF